MKKAFTLIEVMLVVGLTLAIGFLLTSFSGRFMAQSAVNDASEQFRGAFNKAQAYSSSGRADSSWGVHCAGSELTLFKGESYDGRDQSADEISKINSHISVSGFEEIIFLHPDARPSKIIPNLEIRWDDLAQENISINSEGIVN